MDSSSRYHQQQLNSSSSSASGLLRFRSAPPSVLEQLQVVEGSCSSEQERSSSSSFLRFFSSNNNKPSSTTKPPSLSLMNSNHSFTTLHNSSTAPSASTSSGTDLPRQSTFPASHFSFHDNNGYDTNANTMTKGVGNYSGSDELSLSTMNRFNNQISFSSSRSPSSSATATNNNRNGGLFFPNYGYWNETSYKRDDQNRIYKLIFDANQNEEFGNNKVVHTLSHQLSFPKAEPEMFVMENMIHFPLLDAVPCKIRAKRGCATHPRSIAERVRRTRISERMK
ncbi:transcription factor bHLH130 isoform X1 [Arachis ipaensis]|uniref:transcription factor bHLH130 isoform X1 n=1 Tax=Arachis ipaensis TaxID=130454 RepID=UPI0007AFC2E7|nr:transcription factor bHLH130 isoform X1 [Arachis ipaensis]XP_025639645.1 transcription factor bHLH130 isoform X1 [Arachis hypogaea]QHO59997.1 Transcription factor [Arachis hypogaea]